MKFISVFALSLLATVITAGAAQAAVVVTAEAPGVENTSAKLDFSGVETFNSLKPGITTTPIDQTFSNSANPATTMTMDYTGANGVQIYGANRNGGAGGTGSYIVAFGATPYTVNFSSTNLPSGTNYFGFWLSSLDGNNQAKFYNTQGQLLLTFNAKDVVGLINKQADASAYYGDPDKNFKGLDSTEPYVFLNFYDTSGSFAKVVFSQLPGGGGYESDNQTVGNYTGAVTGMRVPLLSSIPGAVPETATWMMMIVGFGVIGCAARHRQIVGVAYA